MKKFHYYNTKDWTIRQQCLLDPVEPVLVVEAADILQADKAFQKEMCIDPSKNPFISVAVQPLGNCF